MMKQLILTATIVGITLGGNIPQAAAAATCQTLHPGTAYKTPDTATIYYITPHCTKKRFQNPDQFFSYFSSWSEVRQTTEAQLAQIPNDINPAIPFGPRFVPQNGDIIKSLEDPKVYFFIENELRHIEDGTTFTYFGYKWEWIIPVDQQVIDSYPHGEVITRKMEYAQPTYALFKATNDPKVYRIEPHPIDPRYRVYRHIVNSQVFRELGYRFDRVLEVDPIVLPNSTYEGEIRHVYNPIVELIEGAPIQRKADARNINVRSIIDTIKTHATRPHTHFLQYEPIHGISFEYPQYMNEFNHRSQLSELVLRQRIINFHHQNVSFLFGTQLFHPILEETIDSYLDFSDVTYTPEEVKDTIDLFVNLGAITAQPSPIAGIDTIFAITHPDPILCKEVPINFEDGRILDFCSTIENRENLYVLAFYNDTGVYVFAAAYFTPEQETEVRAIVDDMLRSVTILPTP